MTTPPKRVLVLGGTGFVGRHVCEKLVAQGTRVTVPTRRIDRARDIQMLPLLDVAVADVHDAAQLARLLPGHDAVVNLIAILHGNEPAFERAHVVLPRTLAAAMHAAGIKRLVHISALGADASGPSMYQRSKARGEAVLRESGLDVTLLRPSVIFGAEDKFLNTFASLQAVAPVMPLAGAGTRFQPVWVEDVAQAVVNALLGAKGDRASIGQTLEACGPETFTLGELVRLAGRCAGHERPVMALPLSVGRLQAALMELLPGEPLMSRDNVASLSVDNVASGTLPGLQALGITPAALSAVAPTYLGRRGLRSALDRMRQGARRF
ncbi:MAG: complex I NDUFA9 subunit family protein [Burkholderiaceae bacterium]